MADFQTELLLPEEKNFEAENRFSLKENFYRIGIKVSRPVAWLLEKLLYGFFTQSDRY
jgi:hypothetical protein